MRFALESNDSFVVITGEVGSGKTTLVRKLLSELPSNLAVAFITHTRLSDVELLQSILVEFGRRPFDMGKVEMVTEIRRVIDKEHAKGNRVIIVVDEAQNLGADVLEELRLLTCLDDTQEKAVNIVLIGQPQLSTVIESQEMEQLRQRCRLRFHLHRLSRSQTVEYIRHRIRVASSADRDIFDDAALSAVYSFTGGVPRLINTLCDTALTMACVAEKTTVGKEYVEQALLELGWSDIQLSIPFDQASNEDQEDGVMGHLTILQDNEVVDNFLLREPSYVIGRAEDCSIRLNSRYLSRHHAIINYDGNTWVISDLNSTNGIRINGKSARTSPIADGDIIAIGVHQILFRQTDGLGDQSSEQKQSFSSEAMTQTFVIVDDKAIDHGSD